MHASDRSSDSVSAAIELYWIPLGAGGNGFVRWNGRMYERLEARRHDRRPLDLYHTALMVRVPQGSFAVENAWPSPDGAVQARGVVAEGPVFSRRLGRWRPFRYEIRRWENGVIPDAGFAVGGPQVIDDDPVRAARVLALVPSVPPLVWGRDERATGEMWNSNSVVSWLLARSGLAVAEIRPPEGGRAPGWMAGVKVAEGGIRE